MKQTILLTLLIFLTINCFSQDPWNDGIICSFDGDDTTSIQTPSNFLCSRTSSYWAKSNRLSFAPLGTDNIFNAHINIIIIQKEGQVAGNYVDDSIANLIFSSAIDSLNYHYNNLVNLEPESYIHCFNTSLGEPVFIPSINIQFNYGLHFISDDNFWGTDHPNSMLINFVNSNPQFENEINILFTMDSVTYRMMVDENVIDPNAMSYNYVNGVPNDFLSDYKNYMVVPNKYAEYIFFLNNYSSDSTYAINHQIKKYARIFEHELGHLFGLHHASISPHYSLNECLYSIMHQGGNIEANTSPWLPPSEIGEIHRLLHLSNTRKYISPNTYFSQVNYVINDDVVWDYNVRVYSDIIIESGGILEINCEVYMPPNSKIIIKPQGILIVNDAIITSYDTIPWQGIQVWGNSTASQFPNANGDYAQGYLELKNDAVIENAVVAIDLWNPGNYSTTGGIVHSNNTNFVNCSKSVHAVHYKNFNPYDPDQKEIANSSYFKLDTFEINQAYLGSVDFYKHADLSHVKGISFKACDFSVGDNISGVTTYNSAIASYDANFNVSAVCSSQQTPCPEEDYIRSSFTGFYSAISPVNDGGSNVTFNVDRADFIDNAYGVKTREMNNASVLNSNFEVGRLWDCGAGIFTDNVTGFAFEDNNFSKYAGGSPSNYFGIIIYNSEAENEIYRNNFNGLSFANFSDGINYIKANRWLGLAYYCNENTNNYADFFVNDFDYFNDKRSGIQSIQGSDAYVTGNTFSQSGATWHFYNGGEHQVTYYHYHNENGTDIETPDEEDKTHHISPMPISPDNNNCPPHYGGDTGKELVLNTSQKLAAAQEYFDKLSDYNSVKTLYESYIDGGDTETEKFDIEMAQPDDMWDLRVQLLGDSPHLSFDVLKKTADKTDVFTEQAIFDIMSANPDELKKDTLISYLENKEQPLPDYMIDILRQLAEGTTYKTVLQQQMADYKQSSARAANEIVRSVLNDSVTDYVMLRNWLDNIGRITSDRQIVSTYISQGNFADALTLANLLPQLYNLEGNDSIEHLYYMEMLNLYHNLHQQGRNTYQLDSIEKASVEFIADTSNGTAGSYAKSIMEAVYNEHYPSCPEIEGTAAYKHSGFVSPGSLNKAFGLNITVKPNPARQWAAFDYTLPESENSATITISSTNGNTLEVLKVSGQQGQKLWDTRSIKPGVYIYTLNAGGFSKSGKIIISK